MHGISGQPWLPYLQRFSQGEWRATIFRDMIIADAKLLEPTRGKLTLLDIGCGGGFDGDPQLQLSLSQAAGAYIGIEPDAKMALQPIFAETHRCFFENAPIEPASIDIAYAVMVLEHLERPQVFWDKVREVLKPNGVFWGFTVDARHWFVFASLLMEKLHVKDWYLNRLHGKRGEARYENYGVYYRSNTPRQIQQLTSGFASSDVINFSRVGILDYYVPSPFRWLSRSVDRVAIRAGLPGSVLAVRVQKSS